MGGHFNVPTLSLWGAAQLTVHNFLRSESPDQRVGGASFCHRPCNDNGSQKITWRRRRRWFGRTGVEVEVLEALELVDGLDDVVPGRRRGLSFC